MRFGKKRIPVTFFVFFALYLVYCFFFTPNFWITSLVVFFPALMFKLFWIDNQPNVLFWGMMMQWLSSSTQLLYSNFFGVTLQEKMKDVAYAANKMDEATLLSTIGLYAFGFGLYFAVRNLRFKKIEFCLDDYSPRKILVLYVILSIIIYVTSAVIWAFPAVVQYLYFFFWIKWGFFVVTFYIVHKRAPIDKIYLYGFLGIEIVVSMQSFFAGEFLSIIMFSIISVVLLQPRLNFRSYFMLGVGIILLVHYLILWSAVKNEYRAFISGGKAIQTTTVSPEVAREKFINLMTTVDSKLYQDGIEKFVNRLGYIQFFAASLNYVPLKIPYQEGKIYLSALEHNLIPRFLNPDKEVLDDSKHTSLYTGLKLSGAKSATSFSLGYIADAYIDFGYIYMFPFLLLVGFLFGYLYSFLVVKSPNEVWVWILTSAFFLLLIINGTDTKKVLGWLLIYFFTVALVRKPLIQFIDPLMRFSSKT